MATKDDRRMDPTTLFISNIKRSFTAESLKALFEKYGEIKVFNTCCRKGLLIYAHCHYIKESSANDAMLSLKNKFGFRLERSYTKIHFKQEQENSEHSKKCKNRKGISKILSIFENLKISSTSGSSSNKVTDCVHPNIGILTNAMKSVSEYNMCKCVTRKSDVLYFDRDSNEELEFNYRLSMKTCEDCGELISQGKILKLRKIVPGQSYSSESDSSESEDKQSDSSESEDKQSDSSESENTQSEDKQSEDEHSEDTQSSDAEKDVMNTYMPKSIIRFYEKSTTYILRLNKKTINETWIGSTLGCLYEEQYLSLKGDFYNACNNAEKNSYDRRNDMLAISRKLRDDIVWYRAFHMDENKYALIDIGNIAETPSIIDIIKCPTNFVRKPMFACSFKSLNENQLLQSGDFHFNIVEMKENEFVIRLNDETATLGSLQCWPVIDRFPNSSEISDSEE